MHIDFKVSGGFGYFSGLARPASVDVDALPDPDRLALERLVEACGFFSLPRQTAAPRGAADLQTYQITIRDHGRTHSVTVPETSVPPELQRLIERLRDLTSR